MIKLGIDETCPHCHSAAVYGCKFGCPQKQPPHRESPRSYEDWARDQREQHAIKCEKCGRTWKKHACPSEQENGA